MRQCHVITWHGFLFCCLESVLIVFKSFYLYFFVLGKYLCYTSFVCILKLMTGGPELKIVCKIPNPTKFSWIFQLPNKGSIPERFHVSYVYGLAIVTYVAYSKTDFGTLNVILTLRSILLPVLLSGTFACGRAVHFHLSSFIETYIRVVSYKGEGGPDSGIPKFTE